MDDLIKTLQNEKYFDHNVKSFRVIQTHISWVILTGEYAYKIKKPVNLGFQDFTTLEKRKHFCELEIKLNKKLAPELYLDVLPITGTPSAPSINGTGEIFEYAIKMKEFPQAQMLSSLAQENKINEDIIKNIALQLADFHKTTDTAEPNSVFGSYDDVMAPMMDNFVALKQMPFAQKWLGNLNTLEAWAAKQGQILKNTLMQRKSNGWIKACHGDLHLGNMVLINNKPVIFDCIEFNENFRWTDIMNDIGFFFMDLHHKNLSPLAQIFINHYLEQSGDYEGATLLNFYASYRAMVRAKVSGFQLMHTDENDPHYAVLTQELEDFIKLAEQFSNTAQPSLSITFGLSASGKSYHTEKLMQQNNTIRLRSDIIRKQLFNLPLYEKTPPDQLETLYSEAVTKSVYDKMLYLADLYLQHGYSVLIDAACLKFGERQSFSKLATKNNIDFKILSFETDIDILKSRLQKRSSMKNEVSDATAEVLDLQLNFMEPLTSDEAVYTEVITQESLAC